MAAPMISGSVGGYSAEFLSPKEQERFTFVKTKICGNKAVDVQNLEKSGMSSLVETLRRLKWMDVATFTEVSYLDLVKAFFICLKSEADGSLVSSVKGIKIKIDHELLHTLFGVKTSGHSGVHSVNDEAKGLGIIGPGFRLKDGKLYINQMSAFNRLLHFIVCQIIVHRSATFSSCTRADSDIMFWVIQNMEINLASVMIERMKFTSTQIWETKSKLNVSLPYAHLLTKIFKHFGVDVSGAVVEKMGQSIRSRNLKKSGFSVQNGIWTKTSVAEGEAIIGDVPEIQEEAADPPADSEIRSAATEQVAAVPVVADQAESSSSPILEVESHPPEVQMEEAVAGVADSLPTLIVASILREVLDSLPSTSVASEVGELDVENAMASGHTKCLSESVVNVEVQAATQQDVIVEETPSQGEQNVKESESMAEGHFEKVVLEEAPAQGEQEDVELHAPIQVEQTGNEESLMEIAPKSAAPSQETQPPASVPVSDGPSSSHVNLEEPVTQQIKQKRVAHRRSRKSTKKVNLKPIMALLKAQGDILSSVQTSVQGILASQASTTSELSSVRNAMKWFNKEMSDMKSMLAVLSRSSGVSPAATQSRPAAVPRPPGPPAQESRPAGPSAQAPGPSVQASGSSGPSSVVKESHAKGKEPMTATKAPDTSTLATPTLSSPPSPSTAPPAPPTIKYPVPRTQPSSSLISSQPSFSPTPSHTTAPSSFSPSPPQTHTPPAHPPSSFNPKHLFYPPTPPSSVTFLPEKPLPLGVFDTNIPDDSERNTLITILSTATHLHRTDSPSPAQKKRKTSSSLSIPSVPLFPPLWYSLTLEPKRRPIYREYLQKCILSTIYGAPFLNLSKHLNIVLPLTQLTHFQKSKIFEGTEFKTEDQWANVKGNKAQHAKYLTARAESLTHRAHPLTLSEWFIIQHKNSWGPFILKEIRIAKNFQLYSDFCYLNKLPEIQFSRFHSTIVLLRSEHPVDLPLKVDFASLKVDSPVLLPKLHSLVFDSDAGSHALDMFARQMGRLSAKQGRLPSFWRFIFREYHSGRISSQTLAPLISECERLSPSEWETLYQASHLHLADLAAINSDLARQSKPTLSAETFLDLNSITPIQEIYVLWAARYSAFYAMKQDLLDHKLFYPISLDRFLHRASFGKSTFFRYILDQDLITIL
ncbi:hypothetical protein Taro_040062 [Colocasia esculenta]|uniref:Putative plant transposon protein domain-containing protein n=1 Tax=Colocasia esculenta TaxID=4460 RepID=A0A843WAW8_COLES|nr:hypothetical protein [Colocasia esculenta]